MTCIWQKLGPDTEWTWSNVMQLLKLLISLIFSSSMHLIEWWGVHFFYCENPNKILSISICRGADVVNKNGIFWKKKNGVNNRGFVETKWRQNKTFRCTLREFYHQLIKEKKIKTKNKELQHRNSDWQFGGFYTWLTKGSVEGSIWLVESEDLDFRATPLDVEMTPWVS